MMIARFGMAAACVVAVALTGSTAVAQVGATAPQTPYQQYQPQPVQSQPYPPPQNPPQQNQPQQSQPRSNPQGPVQRPQQQYTEPQPPPPPFVLTPEQQADLDKVLDDWERQSGLVNKFQCDFTKWTYDPTFLPPTIGPNGDLIEQAIKSSTGEIKYRAPDEGLIRDKKVREISNPGSEKPIITEHNYGEYWACDGKILSAVDDAKKQVHRTKLPPEMQGKFISEGPLPFAFGTKAAPLKARYYLRIITPPDKRDQVWLEIRPRFQKDLTNFIEVQVVLRAKDMLPTAIQITHAEVKVPVQTAQGPKIVVGRQREVYVFAETWVWLPNLFGDDFLPHPLGYTIIDEPMPGQQTAPPANDPQARRQWPPSGPTKPY